MQLDTRDLFILNKFGLNKCCLHQNGLPRIVSQLALQARERARATGWVEGAAGKGESGRVGGPPGSFHHKQRGGSTCVCVSTQQ